MASSASSSSSSGQGGYGASGSTGNGAYGAGDASGSGAYGASGSASSTGGGGGCSNDPCEHFAESDTNDTTPKMSYSVPAIFAKPVCKGITKIPHWPGAANDIAIELSANNKAKKECTDCDISSSAKSDASGEMKVCGVALKYKASAESSSQIDKCKVCDPDAGGYICVGPAHETDKEKIHGDATLEVEKKVDLADHIKSTLGGNKVGKYVLDKLDWYCGGWKADASLFGSYTMGADWNDVVDIRGSDNPDCDPTGDNCTQEDTKATSTLSAGVKGSVTCETPWFAVKILVKVSGNIDTSTFIERDIPGPDPACEKKDCLGGSAGVSVTGDLKITLKVWNLGPVLDIPAFECKADVDAEACWPLELSDANAHPWECYWK